MGLYLFHWGLQSQGGARPWPFLHATLPCNLLPGPARRDLHHGAQRAEGELWILWGGEWVPG